MKKTAAILALLTSFLTHTPAQATSVQDFVGKFKLVEQRYGMCDYDFTSYYMSGGILMLGGHYFTRINRGQQYFEDNLTKVWSNDYTTHKGELIQVVTTYNKTSRTKYTNKVYVKLTGNKLFVRNELGAFPDLPTVCVYRKLAN